MIAIIDYDAGNIRSVEKALILLGQDVKVTGDRDEILAADKVILPGVGAFGDAMATILEGTAQITIDGVPHTLSEGEAVIMPAGIPHAVKAVTRFKMYLVVVKA